MARIGRGQPVPRRRARRIAISDTPPETEILTGPVEGSTISDPNVEITFSSPDPDVDHYKVRLNGGSWDVLAAGVTDRAYSALADDDYLFEVVAVDAGGNEDQSAATLSWTVDTLPDTVIDAGPDEGSTGTEDTYEFEFSSSAVDFDYFEVQIDGGGWVTETSPYTTPALDDGSHTFEVRSVDTNDNVDSTPATRHWDVDLPPDTVIDVGPEEGSATSDTGAVFEFSSPDGDLDYFEVQLNGGGWTTATSPKICSALADDDYTFEVRAVDLNGTPDPSPATRNWTVDTTGVGEPALILPTKTRSRVVAAGISTSDPSAAGYEMRIWGEVDPDYDEHVQPAMADSDWIPYSPTYPIRLDFGKHTKVFYLQLKDNVGNISVVVSDTTIYDPWALRSNSAVDMIEALPPFEHFAPDIRFSLDAIGLEIDRVDAAIGALIDDFFANKGSEYLRLWEATLGLPVEPADRSPEQRRSLVITFLRRLKNRGTGLAWEQRVTELIGPNWWYIEDHPYDYRGVARDRFNGEELSNRWLFGIGAGTDFGVADGELTPYGVGTYLAYWNTAIEGRRTPDQFSQVQVLTGADQTGADWGAVIKYLDEDNFLVADVVGGDTFRLRKNDTGSFTILDSVAVALDPDTNYWIKIDIDANTITAQIWDRDPLQLIGDPMEELIYTMAGGNATKFGTVVEANPGWYLDGVSSDFRVRDWACGEAAQSADDYTIVVVVPFEEGFYTTYQIASLLRSSTPAALDLTVLYDPDGFILGVSELGSDRL